MLVSDVMLPLGKFPVVYENEIIKICLEGMGKYKLGISTVVDKSGHLVGVFTDGDLRRKLLNSQKPSAAFFVDDVVDHMFENPLTVTPSDSLHTAIQLMEEHQVWDLPVVDYTQSLVGLLHLHPAVKALLLQIN